MLEHVALAGKRKSPFDTTYDSANPRARPRVPLEGEAQGLPFTASTMRHRAIILPVLVLAAGTARAWPQAAPPTRLAIPTTELGMRDWGIAIVRRTATILSSPDKWNRSDASPCTRDVSTFSLRCALSRAADDVAGRAPTPTPAAPAPALAAAAPAAPLVECRFHLAAQRAEGNCGELFDESTVFSIQRVKAVTTGVWQRDATPSEVWSGRMTNAENPAADQVRMLIDSVFPGKYRRGRLVEFNNDSSATFADLLALLRRAESSLARLSAADLARSSDDVDIESYGAGKGVIRTYTGWYAVTDFSASGDDVRFRVDTAREVSPNALDGEIVQRADAILSSNAVWNRADNRKCPATATTWSIYCALERATRELTGGFHHRRPALELVRVMVEERTKNRDYNHRLMDYNNDSTTHIADVHALFADALAKIRR